MTTLTQRELDELLLQYDEWLRNDAAGKSPVFAGMDLSGLELKRVNLYHADFRGCTLFYFPACPCEGSFIGYKKAVTESGYAIVRPYIPEDAKRNSATSYRCRADRARVLEITDETGRALEEARSGRDESFVYRRGQWLEVREFDEDRWNEKTKGIHFYLSKEIAMLY